MAENENYVIRVRRGTTNEWAVYNPILGAGELGYDTTATRLKVGDGLNVWSNLDFATGNSFDVARDAGFTGTLADWLVSIKGKDGIDGVGPPNVLVIGSVSTGAEPAVSITGDSPNQVLDFVLPAAGEPIEYTKATPAKDGLMPKEDKAILDSTTVFTRSFLAAIGPMAGRSSLGLNESTTYADGELSKLNLGVETYSRSWSAKILTDWLNAKAGTEVGNATYENTPNTLARRNEYGGFKVNFLELPANFDPVDPGDVTTKAYVDSIATLKGEGAPSIDVVDSGVYVDTATGDTYLGVDRGPEAITNLATNPSFQSHGTNLGTAAATTFTSFKCVSLNLLYQSATTGNPIEQQWAARKVNIANYINTSMPDIMSLQESQITPTGSSISEVHELLTSNYQFAEIEGCNNGTIYNSSVFTLEDKIDANIEINEKFLSRGIQRNISIFLFRHNSSRQRLVLGTTHFNQGDTGNNPASRVESAKICAQYLTEYAHTFGDKPAIILSGDFNATTSLYPVFSDLGFEPSKTKATTTAYTAQGSHNSFNVNGNTSGNWIDENYSNYMLDVLDARLWFDFADGVTFPLTTDWLSDHNPVETTFKFKYTKNIMLNGSNSEVTTGGNANIYYSTEWSSHGDGSACIVPTGSNTSAFYPGGQSNGMSKLGFAPGNTYTVSTAIRLEGAQSSPASASRRIAIGCEQNGSTSFSFAVSPKIADGAGYGTVSVTFTLPADATDAHIRLLNGSATTLAWFDDLMITEGDIAHPYFDGDTIGCHWNGIPHGSTSTYPGPSWVKVN